jgi:hypothetical protein
MTTYPLALPTHTGIRSIEFRSVNAVAYERSPFTFVGQAQASAGQMWMADVTLPPMKRADAEKWVAWLISLRGQYGTFHIGDPLADSPAGTASSATITGTAGNNYVTATMSGTLLAGDWFSVGSGLSKRLYKVTADRSGSGTMDIYPSLRADASGAAADLTYPQGLFRLASNETSWSVNEAAIYGISFSAMEAV